MTSPKKSVPQTLSPAYGLWCGMNARCSNPNHSGYSRYGGRGITVCKRWRGKGGFGRFIADMGPRPSKRHSVERMNNNKGYSPSNCKWATREEQAQNQCSNRMLTFDGKTQCLAAWADELGIPARRIWARLNIGWSIKRAFTAPAQNSNLTFNGRTQRRIDWAREIGIASHVLYGRLKLLGWSIKRAFTTPVHVKTVSKSRKATA